MYSSIGLNMILSRLEVAPILPVRLRRHKRGGGLLPTGSRLAFQFIFAASSRCYSAAVSCEEWPMKNKLTPVVLLLAFAGAPASAETLVLDKVRQDAQAAAEQPSRGMHMQTVSARFGEPKDKLAAVGEPPIARWIYDGYVVYFEKDRVLHTVARR
jgi:hypothetical protein